MNLADFFGFLRLASKSAVRTSRKVKRLRSQASILEGRKRQRQARRRQRQFSR